MGHLLLGRTYKESGNGRYLYVDAATGNDTRTYQEAQNPSTPWATIGRAARGSTTYASPDTSEAAQAGDTVLVTAGIYSETGDTVSGARYSVALNPANSGTADNPITFRGLGTVDVRATAGSIGPIIGSNGKNYIIWDNFYINEANLETCADTGPVVLWSCTGCQFINSTVIGDSQWTADNHNGVRLEGCTSCIVKNNSISNIWDYGGVNLNAAGVMVYGSTDTIIEHNEISNVNTGVYLKGQSTTDPIVRYNLIHDMQSQGVETLWVYGALIYQNIFHTPYNGTVGVPAFRIVAYSPPGPEADAPTDIQFFNNTSYGLWNDIALVGLGGTSASAGHIIKNNIFADGDGRVYDAEQSELAWVSDLAVLVSDRNVAYNYASPNFGKVNTVEYPIADWRTTVGQDANTITTDPQFVNAAGLNFHLTSNGQGALTVGRVINSIGGTNGDTIPAGAYITGNETIGIET